jgi:DNA polymerase I
MMKLGRAKNVRFPSRWRVETFDQFAGAYVMEPTIRGIIKDVHVFDFSAMYPSIMISWNMSPETFAGISTSSTPPPGHCLAPGTNALFRTDQEGLLPHALKSLMEKRKHWNDLKEKAAPGTEEWKDADRRSTALKVCVNSGYGVSGAQTSRLYRREVAESTTQVGVWLIKQTIGAAEDRGYTPFYSDTDSGFVVGVTENAFREFVNWCNDTYYGKLTATLGLRENRIKVAYEKAFSILLMVGKKRYAAKFAHYKGKRAVEDSKAEIKGLEFKRGDTARLARQLQFVVINRLLAGAQVEEMHTIVQSERRRIFETKLSFEDVKVSKTLKRDPRMYTAVKKIDGSDGLLPPHVRVANQLIAAGENVNEGSRVAYVVVDAGAATTELVPESQYTGEYDCHYLWENLVYPPTMRLLEACFPAVNWNGYLHTRPPASSRDSKNQLSFF